MIDDDYTEAEALENSGYEVEEERCPYCHESYQYCDCGAGDEY